MAYDGGQNAFVGKNIYIYFLILNIHIVSTLNDASQQRERQACLASSLGEDVHRAYSVLWSPNHLQ